VAGRSVCAECVTSCNIAHTVESEMRFAQIVSNLCAMALRLEVVFDVPDNGMDERGIGHIDGADAAR